MKKFWSVVKVLLILAVIGIVVYKAYEYFTKDDMLEDFDDEEEVFDEEPDTITGKIKAAAKKVVG